MLARKARRSSLELMRESRTVCVRPVTGSVCVYMNRSPSTNISGRWLAAKGAQTALRRFRGRGLLCDEVGLGKTIEAGLALKEYLMRQMAERVLILTPPALVEQWREELAGKFRLGDFVTSFDPVFREQGARAWETFPRVIASLATARRAEHRGQGFLP